MIDDKNDQIHHQLVKFVIKNNVVIYHQKQCSLI